MSRPGNLPTLSGRERLVPVVVHSESGFRPAELDPATEDNRWLGCQVGLELS